MRQVLIVAAGFLIALGMVPRVVGQPGGAAARAVDDHIGKKLNEAKIAPSPLADDAEFLRRVFLDLTGRIPGYERAVSFLDSNDPERRKKLIDELLASPDCGRHFATIWTNVLLPQDTPAKNREIFQLWMAAQLNQNRGWDKVAEDLLIAEGEPAKNPAAVFTLGNSENNQIQPNLLAASTTRHFLGVQLQCAECHHHPFTSWKQNEFWGMAAFFSRVKNLAANKKGPLAGVQEVAAALAPPKGKKGTEVATGAAIVIPNTAGKAAGSVVKAKFLEGAEPKLEGDDPYRPSLAKWVVAADNKFFARAAVNRLWAHLFGLGIVNPIDDMHADNPASHPELLSWLAEDFKKSNFDFKHLLRGLCNSQAYQRTSRPLPENKDDKELFSHMTVKVMSPEVLYDSLTRALGVSQLKITVGATATTGIGGAKKAPPSSAPRENFIKFFRTQDSGSVATDFTHGIPQALSLMNDPELNKASPVVAQLIKAGLSPEKAIEQLYLTVLSRRPSAHELKVMSGYLSRHPDAARGYAGVQWILLNTPEFVLIR